MAPPYKAWTVTPLAPEGLYKPEEYNAQTAAYAQSVAAQQARDSAEAQRAAQELRERQFSAMEEAETYRRSRLAPMEHLAEQRRQEIETANASILGQSIAQQQMRQQMERAEAAEGRAEAQARIMEGERADVIADRVREQAEETRLKEIGQEIPYPHQYPRPQVTGGMSPSVTLPTEGQYLGDRERLGKKLGFAQEKYGGMTAEQIDRAAPRETAILRQRAARDALDAAQELRGPNSLKSRERRTNVEKKDREDRTRAATGKYMKLRRGGMSPKGAMAKVMAGLPKINGEVDEPLYHAVKSTLEQFQAVERDKVAKGGQSTMDAALAARVESDRRRYMNQPGYGVVSGDVTTAMIRGIGGGEWHGTNDAENLSVTAANITDAMTVGGRANKMLDDKNRALAHWNAMYAMVSEEMNVSLKKAFLYQVAPVNFDVETEAGKAESEQYKIYTFDRLMEQVRKRIKQEIESVKQRRGR